MCIANLSGDANRSEDLLDDVVHWNSRALARIVDQMHAPEVAAGVNHRGNLKNLSGIASPRQRLYAPHLPFGGDPVS